MKLYLMRHGEALSAEADPERGLSDNGKEKIKALAEYLQQQDLTFKCVFHSWKKRALQTAEIMTGILSPNVSLQLMENITPTDDPGLIVPAINSWNEDTLMTSHLPFIPNLVTLLTGQDVFLSAISFEAGTIVCLEKGDNETWTIKWSTAPSEINNSRMDQGAL